MWNQSIRKYLLWLWRWGLLIVLGAWLFYFDAFGLGQAADQASEKAFYRVSSGFYPSQPAQSKLLVVLINDTSINNLFPRFSSASDWPLSYLDQVNLLSQLLRHNPSGIFFDVMWMKQRVQDATYDRAIAKLEKLLTHHKVPIYFAQGSVQTTMEPKMQALLDKLGTRVVNGWEGVGTRYPLNEQGFDTAAMALYRRYCEKAGCDIPDDEFKEPMSVRWKSEPADVLLDYRNNECEAAPNGFFPSIADASSKLYYAAIQGMVETPKRQPVCMPHQVLYADEVFALNRSTNENERSAVHGWVKDSLILIGGQFEGLHDYTSSPVHGAIPGIFLHSMALDNLIIYGDSYIQESSVTQLLSFLFWVVFAALLATLKTFPNNNVFISWMSNRYWFVVVLYALLMLWVNYGLLNFAPSGWLSLLALGWVGLNLLKTRIATFDWRRHGEI